jgi:hypothetical protein
MSNLKEQLDVDILRFLENIETQNHSDKIQTLRHLFDKYLHLNKAELLLDIHDLSTISNNAKNLFASQTMPVSIGSNKRLVNPADLPSLCIVEATISLLNKKDCLKRVPRFDKREDKL